jgi:hypothetical protein
MSNFIVGNGGGGAAVTTAITAVMVFVDCNYDISLCIILKSAHYLLTF